MKKLLAGRYRLLKTIGEGGQGKVKLAEDNQTGAQVAVKLCHGLSERPKLVQEVKHLQQLNHPNIIRCYDSFDEGSVLVIVLELGRRDLFDVLEVERSVEEKVAKRFFRQLVSAIQYCHAKNICHRDLKPENLLLDGDLKTGQLKVCDFGLASVLGDAKGSELMLKTLCGSESYAAPEIYKRKGYKGKPVDVWSAGIILYNIITGFSPWSAAVVQDEVFSKFVSKREEFWRWSNKWAPKKLSPELMEMLDAMLDPKPEKRCSAEDLMGCKWLAPSKTPVSPVGCITTQMSQLQNSGFGEEGHVYRSMSDGSDVAPKPIKPMMPEEALKTKVGGTQFQTTADIDTIWPRITEFIKASAVGAPVIKDDKLKVKASLKPIQGVVHGPLEVKVTVQNGEESATVLLQKVKGDYFQFKKFFAHFKTEMLAK